MHMSQLRAIANFSNRSTHNTIITFHRYPDTRETQRTAKNISRNSCFSIRQAQSFLKLTAAVTL